MTYPPYLSAHAEPSAAVYHVHCPACGGPVAGAVAVKVAEDLAGALWTVPCPRCGSGAPGRLSPDAVLPFGPYSGRSVSSLGTSGGRDYLDYLLHTQRLGQGLRLAILWHLGWLSATRQHVPAGPDLARLRAAWDRDRGLRRPQPGPAADEPAREQAGKSARQSASWVRQFQAEELRQRRGRPANPQQFHEYRRETGPRPPEPESAREPESTGTGPSPSVPAWVAVLDVPWPATAAQVRRAYRRLSKRHHPDVGGSQARMQQLNQAREQAGAWLRKKEGRGAAGAR